MIKGFLKTNGGEYYEKHNERTGILQEERC